MPCTVPPTILRQPASQVIDFGDPINLFVIAFSSLPITYQWYKGVTAISGATSPSYTIPSSTFGDAGTYYVDASNTLGSVRSAPAVITVVSDPKFIQYITNPPGLDASAIAVGSAFSITADVSGGAIEYKWKKNGSDISGATSATYSVASSTLADTGSYRISFKNPSNPVFQDASSAITVTVINTPLITAQPVSIAVPIGTSATFSVTATGTGPLSYQWYKDSSDISGATSSTYTTPATVLGDNGAQFKVRVSNIYGAVFSNTAVLTVVTPPVITGQPSSGTVIEGGSFSTCVSARGYDNRYQWYKTTQCGISGEPVDGATGPCLSFSPASADNAGSYYVIITNDAGEVISVCITLFVEVIDCVRGLIGFAGGAVEGANMASGLTSQKERVVLRCHNAEVLPRARDEVRPECLGGFVPNFYAGGTSSGALLQSRINAQIVCDLSMNLALAKRRMSVQPCPQSVSDTRFLQYQRLGPPVPCAPPPTGFIVPYNPAVPTAIDGPCVNVIGIKVTRP
jgi:hypothetical protein